MITIIGCILAAILPAAWEVWNDHEGDFDKKRDVIVRGIVCLYSGAVLYLLTKTPVLWGALLAAGTHFLIFDYWVVWVLRKNKIISPFAKIFSYLGKSSVQDKWSIWINIGPWGRLLARVTVFVYTLYLFITM